MALGACVGGGIMSGLEMTPRAMDALSWGCHDYQECAPLFASLEVAPWHS